MKKGKMLTIYTLVVAGVITFCWFAPFSLAWQIVFTSCFGLTLIGLFLTKLKYVKVYKGIVTVLIFELIALLIVSILYYTGLIVHFESKEKLQQWFESFGAWAWVIFFLIQIAQVLLIPLPSQITTLAGVMIFGPWIAFLISTVAVISGSVIAFAIGRSLGVKVAIKISSKETVDKYRDLLTKKGVLFLPIMFLFPLFPDDLLCFIAGTTRMSWLYFNIVTLLTRPLGIGLICFFGSGSIIPFNGWGIPVWITLLVVLAIVAIVLMKHQDAIINWVIEKFGRKTKLDNLMFSNNVKNNDTQSTNTEENLTKQVEKTEQNKQEIKPDKNNKN